MVKEIPFVIESDVTGGVAAVFEDIRQTMNVATVNLIWRHLATDEGVLDEAWSAVKPLYIDGAADAAVQRLGNTLEVGEPTRWSTAALADAKVPVDSLPVISAVFETYNRGNAYNLVTLLALVTPPNAATREPRRLADRFPPPTVPIPGVPELGALSPTVANQIVRLNRFGLRDENSSIVATLYKHLAHWPGMLDLLHADLAPMSEQGTLERLIDHTLQVGSECGAIAATALGPTPQGPAWDAATVAIHAFVNNAISRMLPIGLLATHKLTRVR